MYYKIDLFLLTRFIFALIHFAFQTLILKFADSIDPFPFFLLQDVNIFFSISMEIQSDEAIAQWG